MIFLTSYIKKMGQKMIALGLFLLGALVLGIFVLFIFGKISLSNISVIDLLISCLLAILLPAAIWSIFLIGPFFKTWRQIQKYLQDSSQEKQQDLQTLLKREASEKEIRWHLQGRYGEYFMILLPDVVIDRTDILTCNRNGIKSYRRYGKYYRVTVILKNGRKKVIDCPTATGVDTIMRWWKS
ncbi:hypothetical protein [Enterococcus wangshanyuanii]|uniref:Uncharacterized protein n=1 Tax=Enterococcus wangshanyuanii TaxID=2005703 RepID=A0ABQ1PSI4_9ENTE|nr:hypothetical protein [Enterococcus wangshanyuanii]GGD02632.1 hypothetical protein GCM10011573_35120 [Enterococcus wangshanyuanii]